LPSNRPLNRFHWHRLHVWPLGFGKTTDHDVITL
jgi:hypothetical protein